MSTFIFGEAMLEYHSRGGAGLRYGGDTLNTAIHLARAGHAVSYVTAVGTDRVSDALVAAWAREGIDTRFVLRHPDRNPGIYAIHLDEKGERSFLYWRDRSAAREMFDLPGMDDALDAAKAAGLVYFSLISLAIVDDGGREKLLGLARRRKALDMAVAYDSNFRRNLWPNLDRARECSRKAMIACTIGLPTNSDERDLWQSGEDDREIAGRWIEAGASLVVVKAAERGCVVASSTAPVPREVPATPAKVVDSSGAGDAFNGGFLACVLEQKDTPTCLEAGQALARKTLSHQGAILI
jgi:2-dehydro-3-deoxygluconokinase